MHFICIVSFLRTPCIPFYLHTCEGFVLLLGNVFIVENYDVYDYNALSGITLHKMTALTDCLQYVSTDFSKLCNHCVQF